MRITLLLGILLSSCDIGGGPDCVAPTGLDGGPTCEDTRKALEIIDKTYATGDLREVRKYVHVTWLPAESFVGDDGRHLWGRVAPVIRVDEDGVTVCDITVATRNQNKVSMTSLAHEVLHCTLVLSGIDLTGDDDHMGPEWTACNDMNHSYRCGLLDLAGAEVAAAGL